MVSGLPTRGEAKVIFGCFILFCFLAGIFGIVISFFQDDPEIASMIRVRSMIGIAIGVVITLGWILWHRHVNE